MDVALRVGRTLSDSSASLRSLPGDVQENGTAGGQVLADAIDPGVGVGRRADHDRLDVSVVEQYPVVTLVRPLESATVSALLERLDGIVLPGGADDRVATWKSRAFDVVLPGSRPASGEGSS